MPYRLCQDASADERAKVFAGMSYLSNEQAHIQLGNETLVRLGPRAAAPGVLRAVHEFDPDLVLRDSGQFAGLIAAEQCGIPHAKVRTGSPSTDMSKAYNRQSVTELRAEFGLDLFWDHHHNAGCVDQLGAGIAVNGETTGDMLLDNVPGALRSVLDDDTYRASAGAAAKDIAALPDIAECASFVESLV